MGFTSFVFLLIFLPLFLFLYNITFAKRKNMMILCASYIFYIWGSPKGALILLITTLTDFLLVKLMASSSFINQRKAILIISLIENIGILAYFKYSNFFLHELNIMISVFSFKPIIWGQVLLPLGMSFIIFHKISYLIDVYYRRVQPAKSFIDFAAYVALFPKLLQGPIIRYHNIADQLKNRDHNINDTFDGFFRFCVGLAKKVLIADILGEVADKVFQLNLSSLNTSKAWLGIFCYTLQIYFDFSGYSDMAIGIARMLGFRFQENFNRPYLAQNFTEFWRRWHISLSNWFKEYLYIPLGGNRVSSIRNYLNLWIVFLICGLWHGANWTFIIWGIYHGFFLISDKVFLMKITKKLGETISTFFTFFFIMIGWVFFRSENIEFAIKYLKIFFGFSCSSLSLPYIPLTEMINNRGIFIVIVAALISFIPETIVSAGQKVFVKLDDSKILWLKTGTIFLFLLLSFASLVNNSFKPFIYFRF
jgi:alginate O-acetyltransferase complex protein AlgI